MSDDQMVELDDKYFQDMIRQAMRVSAAIQDPEIRKVAFSLTYEHLLHVNKEHLEFEDVEEGK